MAKRYPDALRGAKILTAMKFRNLFKSRKRVRGKRDLSLIGGTDKEYRKMFYNNQIQVNLRSRAFGKAGLQELSDTERARRR